MRREQTVAVIAGIICLFGLYGLGVAAVTPSPDIALRDIGLPRSAQREPVRLSYGRFESSGPPARNPFNFSEGWRRLDAPEIPAPPIPAPSRIVPMLGDVGSGLLEGMPFAYVEDLPVEVAAEPETASEGEGN